ncbi:hypothetical protein RU820_05300 [Acidithiobacillus ferrooxidans]|uniref:hypothetical protein n=1 Tax=Acidithiobacillus ferrooxidans TaxID=920 RepID=UPI0005A019C3|nr:hypothetical protein [Acidithiobacillus ferrooxidans]
MMHLEPATVTRPVAQAVARYQAVVAQIRAGDAAIAARIHADKQVAGTEPAKPSAGKAHAPSSPGPFANTTKEVNTSSIRP